MLPTYVIRQAKKFKHSQEFAICTPNTKTAFNERLFYISIWLLSFSLDEPQKNIK